MQAGSQQRDIGYLKRLTVYGGFHQWGYPNSWMVYFMENPIFQMDDLGIFRGTPMT